MYNNIIYFILVLLLFNLHYPDEPASAPSFLPSLGMLLLTWAVFAFYSRYEFRRVYRKTYYERGVHEHSAGVYQRTVTRLSVLAILAFSLTTYLFHFKYWLERLPLFREMLVLQGTAALCVFLFYLATIWYYAHPVYRDVFDTEIGRRSFILSNLRLNLPILFPWFLLSLIYDLLGLSPWAGPEGLFGSLEAQMIFFIALLGILMIFLPALIRFFWGCRPLESSSKGLELKRFLKERGFRYRDILKWPAFEGKMLTAGIMGIVPRYRYLLITDALLQNLTIDELKAVAAHEMGHARYKHLLFYVLFFAGFIVLSFGLFDLFLYLAYVSPFSGSLTGGPGGGSPELFFLTFSLPMLLAMLVYFRFVMGFFMRHFERQADLHSAWTMGTTRHTINSLEKIGLLSGKTRDLPSWHHFSIKERTEFLDRAVKEPGLFNRHNRFLKISLLVYLVLFCAVAYILNFSPLKEGMLYRASAEILKKRISEAPGDPENYKTLAFIYQEMGKLDAAADAYKSVIRLDPENAVALNNLAWLLVTAPDRDLRDGQKGLELAKKAVELEENAVFLDTLAEAYYVNGRIGKAVDAIQEAMAVAKGEKEEYYREQLRKFRAARQE